MEKSCTEDSNSMESTVRNAPDEFEENYKIILNEKKGREDFNTWNV